MLITSGKKRSFFKYKAPALVYIVLIFIVSSIPGYEFPELPFNVCDKSVHLMEFGLLGIFVFWAFRFPHPVSRPYLLTVAACIPYAALDEIHQLFVQGRNCDIIDFATDVSGILIFAGISALLHPIKKQNVRQKSSKYNP